MPGCRGSALSTSRQNNHHSVARETSPSPRAVFEDKALLVKDPNRYSIELRGMVFPAPYSLQDRLIGRQIAATLLYTHATDAAIGENFNLEQNRFVVKPPASLRRLNVC